MGLLVENGIVVDRENCLISSRTIATALLDIIHSKSVIDLIMPKKCLSKLGDGTSISINISGLKVSFSCEDGGLNYVDNCQDKSLPSNFDDWLTNPLDLLIDDDRENLEMIIINQQKLIEE
jgi:hypothetical protein